MNERPLRRPSLLHLKAIKIEKVMAIFHFPLVIMSTTKKGVNADPTTISIKIHVDNNSNPLPIKPKRPMTAYHVYSQLERNYIIQNHPSYQPNTHDDGDQNNPNQESTSIDENASERPPKYRGIIMPKDWFLSRKGEIKKKDRKNHGVISFVELSKTVSYNWKNEADEETKAYCKKIADEQLARYREEMASYVEQYGVEAVKSKSKSLESKSKGRKRKQFTKTLTNSNPQGKFSQHFVQRSTFLEPLASRDCSPLRPQTEYQNIARTTSKLTLCTVSVPHSKSFFPLSRENNNMDYFKSSTTNNHAMDSSLKSATLRSQGRTQLNPEGHQVQGHAQIATNILSQKLFYQNTQFDPVQGINSHSQNLSQNELMTPLDHCRPHPLDGEIGDFLNRILSHDDDGCVGGVGESEEAAEKSTSRKNLGIHVRMCSFENSNRMQNFLFTHVDSSSTSSVRSTIREH
ncbi:hypothetical protein ACHAXS_002766 [Conticribra weissflogii]